MLARHLRPIVSGSAPAFDPATLALTGWWRANYSGSPWSPTASAGASGTNGDLANAGSAPNAIGGALNGLQPANFDASLSQYLDNANDVTAFLGLSTLAYSISCLFTANSSSARSVGAAYQNAAILTDSTNGFFCLTFTNDGVTMMHYDGTFTAEVTVACPADGNPHLIHAWFDGTNINLKVDSTTGTPDAASAGYSVANADLRVGANYNATAFLDGRIWDLLTSNTDLGSTARTNITSYVNSTYATSF